MKEAAPWGTWRYDRTPGNEVLDPEELTEFLADAHSDPHEIKRYAYIALELATHPEVDDINRQVYLAEATQIYDRAITQDLVVPDCSMYFTHAFLPLLGDMTVTARKKANKLVRERSRDYLAHLEKWIFPTSPRMAIGKAAELLTQTALRQMGFQAQPSLFRQDNSIPSVKGMRYSWDVTATKIDFGFDEENPLRLQIKHRDYNDGKLHYHPDITVHRVFPSTEQFNKVQPKIFGLLHSALGIDAGADPAGYIKYIKRLDKDLQNA